MIRRSGVLVALAACLLAVPTVARAQSAIAGVVKDTSGAVLPGVTVEAASEVLIEKTRAVTTDGAGAYKIIDLRPGTYVVTFTLPGFQTVKRDAIELPSEFTATINADLKVGSIEETITVTTASPIVDVQSAAHTQVLTSQDVDNLPSGRTIQGIGQMIVGVSLSLPDVGGSRAAMQTYMSVRGNSAANNTVLVDGMVVNGLEANGAVQSYFNDAMSQEMSYQTAGIDASVSAGGVRLNMIPKEGGNRFSGSGQVSYRPGQWQGNNLTQRLQDAGVSAGNSTDYIYDLSGALGGPVAKDKIWFFATARDYRTNNGVTNTFQDNGSQGKDYNYIRDGLARVTWQMNSKTKIAGYYDRVIKYRSNDMQSLYDPETASLVWTSPNYSTGSVKVTSTMTSRLLLEAGWAFNIERRNTEMQSGIEQERGTAAWFAGATRTVANNTLGGASTSAFTAGSQWPDRYSYNLALSYITGSHHIKGGVNGTYGSFYHETRANADLYQEYASVDTSAYTSSGGALRFIGPSSVVVRNTPVVAGETLDKDLGFYIQDTYTMKRLTVSAGIRYEMLSAGVQGLTAPAGRFVPERTAVELAGQPDWTDIAPRFQAVLDVFGNSKTAIKYSINRYNASQTTSIAAGFNTLSSATSRISWTDLNGDDIAQGARTWSNGVRTDCVYLTPGCEINLAQLSSTFGIVSDSGTYAGFPRQYSLEQGIEVQHELLPRVSISGGYYYGSFRNLTTTLNRAITPADYTPVTIFNPIDGTPITIYNQSAASLTRASQNETFVDDARKQIFDSYSLEARVRAGKGINIGGGLSWGRTRQTAYGTATSTNNCTVGQQQNPNLLRFCDEFNLEDGTTVPYSTNIKLNASYPVPWQGLILSAVLQSIDDGGLAQSYTLARTPATRYPDGSASFLVANQPAPAAPNGLAGTTVFAGLIQASQSVPLRNDEIVHGERLNQLDIKIGKTFKIRGLTIAPNFEVFNVTNSDKVITYGSTSYAISAGTYLKPNSIVQGRIIGIGTSFRW